MQITTQWKLALGMALLLGTAAAQQAPSPTPVENNAEGKASAVKDEVKSAVKTEEKASASAEAPGAGFTSRKEKVSYALGVDLASRLQSQSFDVDPELVVKALQEALAGNKLRMTGEEIAAVLRGFEEDQKHDYQHAVSMVSEKNKKAAEAFVAENVKKEGIVTLPSGLQYKILKKGDGKTPTLNDKVVCQYRGTLLDGKEFDSSYKRNQPATLPVKGIIKGWSEALQLMPVGSKWQLFIPPQLGYGEKLVGGIGPNAMLVFEVELLSIEEAVAATPQPAPVLEKKDSAVADPKKM